MIKGWTAKEMMESSPEYRAKFRACPSCHRYFDNRNWKRHYKACLREKRRAEKAYCPQGIDDPDTWSGENIEPKTSQ